MKKLVVHGAKKLIGMQKVQGSKNACLPIIVAGLLIGDEVVLNRCPILSDSLATCNILKYLGCSFKFENNTLIINSKNLNTTEIPINLMNKLRSSIIFLGAILARCKNAVMSFPGGCKIGKRPIDLHLNALKQMGVNIQIKGYKLICNVNSKNLMGANINLTFPSVGATENILLAACTATGTTTINNAAVEPEIVDLCNFLKKCGAKIKGAGTKTLVVEGVSQLHPCNYEIMADRIVAATLICAVAATKGELFLKSIHPSVLNSIFPILKHMGCVIETFNDGIFFKASNVLKTNFTIQTKPFPGFPTDLQPIFMALSSIAQGRTTFIETIFENRFKHIYELNKFGAAVSLINRNKAIVIGKQQLQPADVTATDLRAGAAMLIAALNANGESTISNVDFIDRGYENIENQLNNFGASVTRIN